MPLDVTPETETDLYDPRYDNPELPPPWYVM